MKRQQLTRMAALACATFALTASGPYRKERFEIDEGRSKIAFVVRHLGVSNVRGEFRKFSGHILLDERDITKSLVQVTVQAGSIDTENGKRDNHLRSEDFFEVARYPTLTFAGRRIEKRGAGLVLIGDLTIRDVTREIAIPFRMQGPLTEAGAGKRMTTAARIVIDRFEYGLKWNRMTEAVAVVGPEVRIELDLEAVSRTLTD